jgi:hypothetical protein
MMKYLCIVVTLTMAFGIMLVALGSLGSVFAQTNTTSNATGGNTTGATQNTTGNQSDTGTASGITNLTGANTESLLNNTEMSDPTTGLQDLQKEQTTTDPNMTTTTK